MLTSERVEAGDVTKISHKEIINLWEKIYGTNEVKVAEIVADCIKAIESGDIESDSYALGLAFLEATGTRGKLPDNRGAGNWLRRNKDKVVDEFRIVKCQASKRATAYWKLEEVKITDTVSGLEPKEEKKEEGNDTYSSVGRSDYP